MKTLLLMIYLLNISHLSESYGDWQHPHYSFRCLENEKLELLGVHPSSKIKICGKEGDPNCTITEDPTGVFSIKYSCMNHNNTHYSAIVSVQDSEFDDGSSENGCFSKLYTSTTTSKRRRKRGGLPPKTTAATSPKTTAATRPNTTAATSPNTTAATSPKTTAATSPNTTAATSPNTTAATRPNTTAATTSIPATILSYVGGKSHHEFLITCKEIPEEGINRTVAHVFQEKDYNELPDNYKEVASVEMRFKAVNNINGPDINTIYIGDEFYMFIKYMGKEDYTIIPEECNAFDEPWIEKGLPDTTSTHKVELWNVNNKQKNVNVEDCVKHKELLGKFQKYNSSVGAVIYAKMYGFRFQRKEYITITCRVRVYKEFTSSENPCMILSSTRRRKRNIENESFQTKELTKKLRVVDNKKVYLAENNSQKLKWASLLWIMSFAPIALHV